MGCSSGLLQVMEDSLTVRPLVKFEGFALLGNPTSPVGLSATADPMAPGEVTLGWSEPALTGQSAITKYQRRYKKTAEADSTYSAWSDVPDSDDSGSDLGDERAVTVTGLEADTPYTFQVRAVNVCCDERCCLHRGHPCVAHESYVHENVRSLVGSDAGGERSTGH